MKEGLAGNGPPLPEGAPGEIPLPETPPEVPPELQAEFEAWDTASATALDLVERLAQVGAAKDQR